MLWKNQIKIICVNIKTLMWMRFLVSAHTWYKYTKWLCFFVIYEDQIQKQFWMWFFLYLCISDTKPNEKGFVIYADQAKKQMWMFFFMHDTKNKVNVFF